MIELTDKVSKMISTRRPQFFKVFLPDRNSKRLIIPSGFAKYMEGKTSGSVFLMGPSGNTWQVNLIQYSDGLCFREGWPAFVKDHSAGFGDFFVFIYDGNFHFTVTIFDESGCEKEVAFLANCSGKKRGKMPATASSNEILEGAPKRSKNSRSKASHEKDVIPSKIKEEDGEWHISKLGLQAGLCLSVQAETDEQRKSSALATNFPFFIRCMKKYNVHKAFVLYVPHSFVGKHCPGYKKKEKIVLQNYLGNQWTVNFVRGAQGASLCGGWLSFVRDNHIKEGDTCMFELVGEFEMRVHICGENGPNFLSS